MLNNILLKYILYLGLAVAAQVLLFNHLNIEGYFPILYIMWIYYFPLNKFPFQFLFLSFLLGLIMDMFMATGGINAFASTLIAYLRQPLVRKISSNEFEYNETNYDNFTWLQKLWYIVVFILIHHSALYLVDNFKVSNLLTQLEKIAVNSAITFIFFYLFVYLFDFKKEK